MNIFTKNIYNKENKILFILYVSASIFRIGMFYIGNESWSTLTAITDYLLLFLVYKNTTKKIKLWVITLIVLMSASEIFNRLDDIYPQLTTYDITATILWYLLLVTHLYKKIKKILSTFYFFIFIFFFSAFILTMIYTTELNIVMGANTIPTLFNFLLLILLGLFSYLNFAKGKSDMSFFYLSFSLLLIFADACFGCYKFHNLGDFFYISYLIIYDVAQYLLIILLANDTLNKKIKFKNI